MRPLCELALASDEATLHAGDLQLKLSDPSLRPQTDVRVWEEDGTPVGFALAQPSRSELNFVVKECGRRTEVETHIMKWAAGRLSEAAAEQNRPAFLFTSARESDGRRIGLLGRHGFTPDESHCVYMRHTLDALISAPGVPEGFAVRPLAGAHELGEYTRAHRNAFWMENFTEEWHGRVLETPFYVPELNLIAEAPGGTFAAFCFSWFEPRPCALRGYLQTLGTRPRFRNLGLGRALLLETLRRFQARGACEAVGVVDAGNVNALRLYEAGGVRRLHKIYRYVRQSDV
ncbi:MAG TPA: N-acetyltransferase [Pyrinomonadaceae bacterium]|nr:N-acetyltransferase [Pyrinomonadaceae bacterium]